MQAAEKLMRLAVQLVLLLCLTSLSPLLPTVTGTESPHHTLDITPASPTAVSANTSAAWSLLSSPSTFLPTARYGHASIALPSSILVTHGYQYDHTTATPLWLSDTYSFSLSWHQWRQVLPPCTERQVVGGVCPCARMGAVLVVAGERAYMYGGDDGGASRGASSYTYNLFGDLWSLPLAALDADVADDAAPAVRWQLEETIVDSTALTALGYASSTAETAVSVAHAQHAAYVRRLASGTSELLVFGGMVPRAGDNHTSTDGTGDNFVKATNTVWRLPLSPSPHRQWQLLSCSGSAPAARYGHSMAGVEQSGVGNAALSVLYVYGGFVRNQPNFNDLHCLTLPHDQPTHCEWQQLTPGSVQPTSRGYATMLASQRFLLLFGGSHCAPGCECSHELWTFDTERHEWSSPQLLSLEQPQGRYKHTAVGEWQAGRKAGLGGCMTMYVFGGESYKPQKYHSDVWRLRYSHMGGGHACESVWEVVLGERTVWEVTAWSIVLLLAVIVILLLRRRVLRQIKTS